ncbi:hypothetical protein, partial [Burkholderia ubonensis]|uniref:hypothetical protein n=1 Tax=Burkholderia ubonensis TaxID=101571 RepID=UPI001E581ABF
VRAIDSVRSGDEIELSQRNFYLNSIGSSPFSLFVQPRLLSSDRFSGTVRCSPGAGWFHFPSDFDTR